MGLIVDTNVFIRFEKSGKAIDLSAWELSERVYVSVLTVSELLRGAIAPIKTKRSVRRMRRLARRCVDEQPDYSPKSLRMAATCGRRSAGVAGSVLSVRSCFMISGRVPTVSLPICFRAWTAMTRPSP
jgi:predicted nucleic acid-binding protein